VDIKKKSKILGRKKKGGTGIEVEKVYEKLAHLKGKSW